ncbi:flavin reductase family protein [Aneurinibacillus thermoaerophilus]|uniref:Flavin reductase family protein n=1 Tax=Aneurinibacillus thermoaerophilus TaxID=143495 RepID=A0A1G8C713_ANETH|nr:flavin reductase family protein [Aneurinibacillus thermoaerophilus]MED0674536.1 flavin reductase family protein [Aneurinibacillus thermoaerophilus]MED0679156.1 flavin reductase family protein [Aneurinibacillus thermoaerophilus]MED0738244.1 flavin reductase family protein [Aneurinibacillus thermoaerophilus]MED0757691.1 flavin reductase family protein [Aneurinibacillus thermoaerophilus]MED0762172.1 flavin reductase family protein [Aneurinibacillus thermoaerophilus]
MNIEPSTLRWDEAYKLMTGSILPRPIAFVSTVNETGQANLAPFSFFTAICADPMMICFAPMRRGTDGARKDTLNNIEATREFVVNIVGEKIVKQMNDCAVEYSPDVDEFEEVGLTKASSRIVKPPRVAESDVQLECVLHDILHFGDKPGGGSLVIGQVVTIHIKDELYFDGKINTEKLNPVGRLAGPVYTRAVSDTFVLERKKQPAK